MWLPFLLGIDILPIFELQSQILWLRKKEDVSAQICNSKKLFHFKSNAAHSNAVQFSRIVWVDYWNHVMLQTGSLIRISQTRNQQNIIVTVCVCDGAYKNQFRPNAFRSLFQMPFVYALNAIWRLKKGHFRLCHPSPDTSHFKCEKIWK